ncbi:MAG: hypothetical protein PHD97_08285, partial [Bacteroidales bacterium]|nr:hypothetical protein [Bacteroidales bacterium]
MKIKFYKLFAITLILFLLQKTSYTYAQSCTSCPSCDVTITGTVASVTVPSGGVHYCIAPGAVVNGPVNVGSSSFLCNSGTINGTVNVNSSATICNEGIINTISFTLSSSSTFYNYGALIVNGNFTISSSVTIHSYCDFVVYGDMNLSSSAVFDFYGRLDIHGSLNLGSSTHLNVTGVLIVEYNVTIGSMGSITLINGTYMSCINFTLYPSAQLISTGGIFSQLVITGTPTAGSSSGFNGNNLDICWSCGSPPCIPPGIKNGTITYCVNNLTPSPPTNLCSPYICPALSTMGNTICSGSNASISAGGADTYTWSTGQTGSVIVVTPGTSTTYTVTGTHNINGCTNSASAAVTVNTSPTVSANGNTICYGGSATITASGANTYSWSNSMAGSVITVNPTITTTYIVTGTAGNGCTNTATAVLNVNNLPSIMASGNTICTGAITNINASGANSFTWNTGQTGNSVTVNPTQTTTYIVTGTDGNGCRNTAQTAVIVNVLPNVTASGNTICIGAITSINASGANNYSWNNSETGSTVTVNPTQTTTYVVTGTDGNTCTNTALAVVNVNPLPIVTASGNTICIGAITNINASGANNYSWDTGQTGNSVTVNPTQTTTYIVTGTDGNTCTNTALAVVNVNPLPIVTASGNTICIGAITNINASGANNYSWDTGQTGSSVTVNPTQTTTYVVTGTDGNTCTNTALAVVNVNPLPVVTASGNTICIGAITNINASGANNYSWDTGQTGSSVTVNPTQTTTYVVTGTDGNTCTNTALAVVNVNPLPVVTASGNTICIGAITNINASGANNYSWDTGQTGSSVNVTPNQTTTYIVTGTDGSTCTNTALAVVNV